MTPDVDPAYILSWEEATGAALNTWSRTTILRMFVAYRQELSASQVKSKFRRYNPLLTEKEIREEKQVALIASLEALTAHNGDRSRDASGKSG